MPLLWILFVVKWRDVYLCGHGKAEEEPNSAAAEGDGALPFLQGGGLDRHQALQGAVWW